MISMTEFLSYSTTIKLRQRTVQHNIASTKLAIYDSGTTFPQPSNHPISSAVPDTLAHITSESVPEQPVSAGMDDPDCKVVSDWETVAQSRAIRFLDQATNLSNSPSLNEVVRDRIWPFYANWLHELLGPCTREAEFDWSDEGDATSVTIYITCESLPHPRL